MKAHRPSNTAIRVVIFALLIFLSMMQLLFTFQGLEHRDAMDQAQISREVARGNGFTTQFIRPIDLQTSSEVQGKSLNALAMKDTYQPPLNILIDAIALKCTGMDSYDNSRIPDNSNIYGPDRIIAGLSTVFFIVAMGLAFYLLRRLFDEGIASVVTVLMILSNLFLQFAASGLPQMLMLSLFLLAMNSLLTAVKAQEEHIVPKVWIHIGIASALLVLMVLSCWLSVWVFLGFLIFVAIHFRPAGAFALPGVGLLLLVTGYFLLRNNGATGSWFGTSVYSIYNGIMGEEDTIMRAVSQGTVPLDTKGLLIMLFGSSLSQVDNLYQNLGSIVITPFFFIALFHTYKNTLLNHLKWALLAMWLMATVGMALYGIKDSFSSSQLQLLFTPFFAAYGLSFIYIMIARLKLEKSDHFTKGFIIFVIIAVSAGPYILRFGPELSRALTFMSDTKGKGVPKWPYFPAGMNGTLHDMTKKDQFIMTDQPWAVAWYADRPALWMPKKVAEFDALENILRTSNSKVQGILITPSSHDTLGMRRIALTYGDFAPLVMDGNLLRQTTKVAPFSAACDQLAPISSRFRLDLTDKKYNSILYGVDMIYYAEDFNAQQTIHP